MKDFFISYNRADRQWAEWIAWQLEVAGYSVVIQAWDFRQGGNFVLDMQRAIEATRRTLIVLSPDFLASQFTAPEWAAAFAQDPTGAQGRLLPVRVRDCQPTGLLAQVVYVDLVGLKDRAQALQRLLAGAAEGRAKPASEPGLPPLDPTQPRPSTAPVAPEPPWPPSLLLVTNVAGSVFWRLVRVALLSLAVALVVLSGLRNAMPQWFDAKPGAIYAIAMLWGLLTALLLEAGLRWWRRYRLRGLAGGTP